MVHSGDEELDTILLKIFESDGMLSKYFDGYSPRQSQIEMAQTVLKALNQEKHALIEAGTGTGKSLGYAFPAALYALKHKKVVIICTHTITLQNQLVNNDLPLIQKVLGELMSSTISYSLAKGRGHLICKRRLNNYLEKMRNGEVAFYQEAEELAKKYLNVILGNPEQESFNDEVPLELWKEVQSTSSDCIGKDSPYHDTCFVQMAKMRVKDSLLIVCNHALFFTDLSIREKGSPGILPEYDAVIFDEGHRIEDVFSNFYQKTVTLDGINRLFNRLIDKRSAWMKDDEEEAVFPIQDHNVVVAKSHRDKIVQSIKQILNKLGKEMDKHKVGHYLLRRPLLKRRSDIDLFCNQYLYWLKDLKQSQLWPRNVEAGFDAYIESVEDMKSSLNHLLLNKDTKHWANWISLSIPKDIQEKQSLLSDEFDYSPYVKLTAAPIEASTLLSKSLFKNTTTITTSATLQISGSFKFTASRLGIGDDFIKKMIGTPFDYGKQSMLIIPSDFPAPNDDNYQENIIKTCQLILTQTKGRAFFLFTSYKHLHETFDELQFWCEEQNITPLRQTPDVNREELIRQFKELDQAVLFGAESFWEGVDIPGDDLQCVVMMKVPFPVPNEPLTEARISMLESRGINSFSNYMLPMAILKLMQGFGRLIRRVDDRGVVVILDSRIHTKRYGKRIIRSLPQAQYSEDINDIKQFINLSETEKTKPLPMNEQK